MLNLGVRAHDFGTLPVNDLAARIAAHGLSCVQLAPAKAIAGLDAAAAFEGPTAATIRDAFRRHGLGIAVLGCYINLGGRDEQDRRPQLERFKRQLGVAAAYGCRLVGTETGSVNADFSPHPDNAGEAAFARVLGGIRELVRVAEQHGACIGIEPVERYVISTPRRLRRLLDELASPCVQVILDPVNLLSSANHHAQDEILAEACELLGDRVAVVHAKDFVVHDGRFEERPAGSGELHYPALLRWIKTRKPGIPVLLENTSPDTVTDTIAFMRAAYAAA